MAKRGPNLNNLRACDKFTNRIQQGLRLTAWPAPTLVAWLIYVSARL